MSNLRDRILTVEDHETQEVPIPEWGFSVWVRVMTSGVRGKWEAFVIANRERLSEFDWRELFVVNVACDADGSKLFTEADVSQLREKHSKAIDRIFEAGMRLNKLSPEDVAELKKTSDGTTGGDFSSNSPGTSEKQLVNSNGP